ncbi:MAG TPA: DUF4292 domain-containing protein, partial [Candidatus Hypogeohydataceae bacterium YC40]
LVTGCASMKGVGPPRATTLEAVRHYVGINSLKITTLKAKVDATIEYPELKSPLSCQGYLRLERPRRLRVVCSKLFTTIFDVVSDGREFWLYVPSEKKVYTGRANQNLSYLGLNFSPNDVAGLLDFEDTLSSKRLLFESTPEYYTLHVFESSSTPCGNYSELRVDKKTLQVLHIESFNTDGSLRMQADLGEYEAIGGYSLPRNMEIYWPAGDTHLTLNLTKVDINEKLDPRVFQLSVPKGAETVRITDGAIGPKSASQ